MHPSGWAVELVPDMVKLPVKDTKDKTRGRAEVSVQVLKADKIRCSRRMPKRGFNNISRKEIVALNVRDLERFENNAEITIESLFEIGLIKALKDGVKILATGELTKALTVKIKVSPAAAKKIVAAGGKVEVE